MNMDKILRVGILFALVGAGVTMLGQQRALMADTGWDQATRQERGSYAAPRSINISSYTGTAIFSSSVKRPDGMCRNNSAFTIWIGTDVNAGYLVGDAGANIRNGLPILSSETFSLGGQFTGTMAATADNAAGGAAVNVRCLDGLVP